MCASAEFTDEITAVVLYPENEEVNKMNSTLSLHLAEDENVTINISIIL